MKSSIIPFISAEGFDTFSDALKDLWSQIWGLILAVGVVFLVAYGIAVAVIWIKAGGDEAQKKRAKTLILYFTTGIILVFVVLVGVPMIVTGLSDWAGNYQ